jgi:hypothetical protein
MIEVLEQFLSMQLKLGACLIIACAHDVTPLTNLLTKRWLANVMQPNSMQELRQGCRA